jgi:selenocysteine lyase/cysteine desulfurase
VVAEPELLDQLAPAKLAPSSDTLPWRFERGTHAFELHAGITATVDWIASLTDAQGTRRERVLAAMSAAHEHTGRLLAKMVDGLNAIEGVRLLPAPERRTSTVSFTVDGMSPADTAAALGQAGVSVWHGDYYAYELMHRFDRAGQGGAVRASPVLYNDESDIDRLTAAVAAALPARTA